MLNLISKSKCNQGLRHILRKLLYVFSPSLMCFILIMFFCIIGSHSKNKYVDKNSIPDTKLVKFSNKDIPTPEMTTPKENREQSNIQNLLYSYLMDLNNRESVKDAAIKLNNGNQRNSCVYFVSESLRRIGLELPLNVCSTGKISVESSNDNNLSFQLSARGWMYCQNISRLLPGDICFTTLSKAGRPTHTYIFKGWAVQGNEDFAYVCDNQSYDYGKTLHLRNIKNALKGKEAFYYFMFMPK